MTMQRTTVLGSFQSAINSPRCILLVYTILKHTVGCRESAWLINSLDRRVAGQCVSIWRVGQGMATTSVSSDSPDYLRGYCRALVCNLTKSLWLLPTYHIQVHYTINLCNAIAHSGSDNELEYGSLLRYIITILRTVTSQQGNIQSNFLMIFNSYSIVCCYVFIITPL